MASDWFDPWQIPDGGATPVVRQADAPVIHVDVIEGIEPLDTQIGVLQKRAVPDVLRDVLFGQPEPTASEIEAAGGDASAVPPMRTDAILDAAKVVNLPDLLEDSGLEHRCLFKGDAYDEMKDVAPWLVRLEEGNGFTRNLFTLSDAPWHLWSTEPGIYVRSRHDFDSLWRHFRKFTRVQDEAGKWFYFRFWDELGRNCSIKGEHWVLNLLQGPDDRVLIPIGNRMTCVRAPERNRDTRKTIVLTDLWKEHLAFAHQAKYARGRLEDDYPNLARTLNDDLKAEWSEHMARRFRDYGLRKAWSKDAYVTLAVLLGTAFDEDPSLPGVRECLRQKQPCYLRMHDLNAAVSEATDQVYGRRYQHFARALGRIAELDEARVFATAGTAPLGPVLRLFPEKARILSPDRIAALAQRCDALSAVFPNHERRIGVAVLFTHAFMLGLGSLNDPLHDYVRRILHDTEPAKVTRLFRYGQKRAEAQLRAIEKFNESA